MRYVLALALFFAAVSTARADVILDDGAMVRGTPGAAGLSGTYYHVGSGATNFSIATTLSLMASSRATGTFVSSSVNYSGNDASAITSFLGTDGASYRSGTAAASYDLSDAILHLTGYYYVSTAGTVTFSSSHDDALQLSVGGKTVVSTNIGNDSANVTFSAPGYYLLDVVYGNTNYNNGVGGASLNVKANGTLLSAANVVQTVIAEPASLALLGAGLLAAGVARRRGRVG